MIVFRCPKKNRSQAQVALILLRMVGWRVVRGRSWLKSTLPCSIQLLLHEVMISRRLNFRGAGKWISDNVLYMFTPSERLHKGVVLPITRPRSEEVYNH